MSHGFSGWCLVLKCLNDCLWNRPVLFQQHGKKHIQFRVLQEAVWLLCLNTSFTVCVTWAIYIGHVLAVKHLLFFYSPIAYFSITQKYRLVQNSGHTGHPRNQRCISVEGDHFEYLLLKQNNMYVRACKYIQLAEIPGVARDSR
jgi:hypothetical protein